MSSWPPRSGWIVAALREDRADRGVSPILMRRLSALVFVYLAINSPSASEPGRERCVDSACLSGPASRAWSSSATARRAAVKNRREEWELPERSPEDGGQIAARLRGARNPRSWRSLRWAADCYRPMRCCRAGRVVIVTRQCH